MNVNGLTSSLIERYGKRPESSARPESAVASPVEERSQRQQAVVPSPESSRQRAERWQRLNTFYDEPPQAARRALEAYQGVQTSERRDQVESMFGVDLYA